MVTEFNTLPLGGGLGITSQGNDSKSFRIRIRPARAHVSVAITIGILLTLVFTPSAPITFTAGQHSGYGATPPPEWQIENEKTTLAIALSGNKTAVNVKIWTSATSWELRNFVDAQYLYDIQCGDQSGDCNARYTTSELLSIAFGFEISREDVISGSFKWSVFQCLLANCYE